jgi:long-chain acyl-CoA synthetase
MPVRRNNEPASWEVDGDKPKPKGETRVRRSFATKELIERKSSLYRGSPRRPPPQ